MLEPRAAPPRRRRLGARGRVWMYCSATLVVIAGSAAISTFPLLAGHREVREVHRDDIALERVSDLRTALSDFQTFVEPRLARVTPASPNDLGTGALLATAIPGKTRALVESIPAVGLETLTRELVANDAAFTKAYSGLSVIASGATNAATTKAIVSERTAFATFWSTTASAAAQIRQVRNTDLAQGAEYLDQGRGTLLAVDGFAGATALIAGIALGERSRRRERRSQAEERRQQFETALQQAFEMSRSETDAYETMGRALHESMPARRVELLVADSSRAHFHQAITSTPDAPDANGGCGVVSPNDCPAAVRGHTLVFPSSGALDACPYLRDRASGACSALCVPVSIAGKAAGVLHATGPDGTFASATDIASLESTARRAAERIAVLRAFEKSETQARSDPLTGLLNRRSLEDRVSDLARDGLDYALAFGDLDNFKQLNDNHGHESGDRALRLFARVLRDAVRPNDVLARYGGEEFLVVLPDCTTTVACSVLERIRERLALSFASGQVPPFTVSFGLASSADGNTFDEVVAVADEAMFAAKAAGRNRVVIAHPELEPFERTSRRAH